MDYSLAFSQLRQNGILAESALFVVGKEAPSNSSAVLFGALGAAVDGATKGHYIFIAGEERLAI